MWSTWVDFWHRCRQRGLGRWGSPRPTDFAAWLVSLVVHLSMLIVLASLTLLLPRGDSFELSGSPLAVEVDLTPQEFQFSTTPQEFVGAAGSGPPGTLDTAAAAAPIEADRSELTYKLPPTETFSEVQVLDFDRTLFAGPSVSDNMPVKGAGSVGASAASGAIDRLTHEILLSLDERPTLVAWLFDQSRSLSAQREAIAKRFDQIYEELGVIQAAGNDAFKRHADQPLLTAVAEFGVGVQLLTPKPTDDLADIKAAVRSVEVDAAGKGRENVFQAVRFLAEKFRNFRLASPRRNVMIIVFTDEAGDDVEVLDSTVEMCRKYEMPVYVIGVPAPFGRTLAYVKYVDPDPNFDQSPQRQSVHQGPESLLPERIKLLVGASEENEEQVDSGFGPFGLCRLAYETGGLYFTVHPNRIVGRHVPGWETAAMSTYMSAFFDPRIMRNYRPDYVSARQYRDVLSSNRACAALVQAAQLPAISLANLPTRFPKIDEGQLAAALSAAQRNVAKVEPEVNQLVAVLRQGEKDREKLNRPRWQVGFDLALGQALAFKVRTESYNAMLAQAKQGMNFQNERSDTWELVPSDAVKISTALANEAQTAKMYLDRVVAEHEGTPWALEAANVQSVPMSWEWQERFTNVAARRARQQEGNAARRQPAPAAPAKPRRPPPDL
jgi:hypothetical protein